MNRLKIIISILIVILLNANLFVFAEDLELPETDITDLNQEYKFDEYIEVKEGTSVKDFIEQEKERRLKEWYADKIKEGYKVKFFNAYAYAIEGTTLKDVREKKRMSENDIVRTNMEIEIGVAIYTGSIEPTAPTVGEGSTVGVFVRGDLIGSGEVDVTSLSLMQQELVEETQLKGAYEKAADMNDDNNVDVLDLSEIQEKIVNN